MYMLARCVWVPVLLWAAGCYAATQSYPAVKPMKQTFDVPDVSRANVLAFIKSTTDTDLYKLQCHSAKYVGDTNFEYSGDFECRLSSVGHQNAYSTLLTEDSNQSRDWESRGRFFADDLRGACARIPQFGTDRSFELRGMTLTLQITDPAFTSDGALRSLKLTVKVVSNPGAQREIAKIVPLPLAGAPKNCKLGTYFVNPKSF